MAAFGRRISAGAKPGATGQMALTMTPWPSSRNSVDGGDGAQQVREARAAVRVSDAQVRVPALEGNPVVPKFGLPC